METTIAGAVDGETAGSNEGTPSWFRAWWQGYRRDLPMTSQMQSFVGRWWRDLAAAMRHFIAREAGVQDVEKAGQGQFETLIPIDQERILGCARAMWRDLKPVTWL